MDSPPLLRRQPAHFPIQEGFNRSSLVLLTVCTDHRRPLLAEADVVASLLNAWRQAEAWQVGRWVVLPDHLHAFCAPSQRDAPAVGTWVKYWKSLASRVWPRPAEHPVWQQGFWDRQLRDGEHYHHRWEYVRNNPVRHGLVADAAAWPWQGEEHVFRFHDPT